MTLAELYPTVRNLSHADKLRLMQLLVVDIAHEANVSLLTAETSYPVWTPLHAEDAADTLSALLKHHRAAS